MASVFTDTSRPEPNVIVRINGTRVGAGSESNDQFVRLLRVVRSTGRRGLENLCQFQFVRDRMTQIGLRGSSLIPPLFPTPGSRVLGALIEVEIVKEGLGFVEFEADQLTIAEAAALDVTEAGDSIVNPILMDLTISEVTNLSVLGAAAVHIPMEKLGNIVHQGRITAIEMSRSSAEDVVYTSRFDSSMIGDVTRGMVVGATDDFYVLPLTGTDKNKFRIQLIHGPMVFNPVVDGQVLPNQNFKVLGNDEIPFFIDPNGMSRDVMISHSVKTETGGFSGGDLVSQFDRAQRAATIDGAGLAFWTLENAIWHLLWTLNANQKFVDNPTYDHISAVVNSVLTDQAGGDVNAGGTYLTGVEIASGQTLPEALRQLCDPFGIDFRLHYKQSALPHRAVFEFFVANNNQPSDLPVLAEGSNMVFTQDAAYSMDITIDTSHEYANTVEVHGAVPELEITIELIPAWDPSQDLIDPDKLSLAEVLPEDVRVWRDWVANENDDYSVFVGGRAGEHHETIANQNKNLHRLFYLYLAANLDTIRQIYRFQIPFPGLVGDSLPVVRRRRRMKPLLTVTDKPTDNETTSGSSTGLVSGVKVEFSDDGGTTWSDISRLENANVSILPDEIGIRFTSDMIPNELWSKATADGNMDNVRIRMTGTVEGDGPLVAIAALEDANVPETKRVIIKKKHKYGHREVFGDPEEEYPEFKSQFYDRVQLQVLQARVADDYRELLMIAAKTVTTWSRSRASGNFKIGYLEWTPQVVGDDALGVSVSGISGRAINLIGENGGYPEITRMTYNFMGQYIQCDLDTPMVSPVQSELQRPVAPTTDRPVSLPFSEESGLLGTGPFSAR
jgi:hypothetical protein